MKNLIIIGAGGHGKVIADIAQKMNKYETISFLDDENIKESVGLPVIDKVANFEKYIKSADIFVAIGKSKIRERFIDELLSLGASLPVLIHPNATIGACVEIGVGSAIMAGAVINPDAKIGKGVIVNTCSSVDHDCIISDYAHISVGARIAGTVKIGTNTWIGAGATVSNNVDICADCMIGAGAVVVKDINRAGIYIGVPAKKYEKN